MMIFNKGIDTSKPIGNIYFGGYIYLEKSWVNNVPQPFMELPFRDLFSRSGHEVFSLCLPTKFPTCLLSTAPGQSLASEFPSRGFGGKTSREALEQLFCMELSPKKLGVRSLDLQQKKMPWGKSFRFFLFGDFLNHNIWEAYFSIGLKPGTSIDAMLM